jgi:dipeptidyl aminopeptidase/acylaminoacyl peptidase
VVGVTELLRALLEMRQAVPLSWSPGGDRLLVASNVPGTHQLYEWPAMQQLTSYDEPVTGRFLPDDRVLVEIDEGGNERTQLHVLGGEPLASDPRFVHRTPCVGGRVLAYATNRRNEVDFDVVARDLSSGKEHVFELAGNNSVAGVSSDGQVIAVDRVGERSGDNDILLCDVASGEVSLLTPHDHAAEFYSPVWTAEGIALSTNDGRDTFAIVRGGDVLFESEWDVELAADESGTVLLAIENADGYSRLQLLGREEVPLPGRGVVDHPVFSPDGTKLAFAFSSPIAPNDVPSTTWKRGRSIG